MLHLLTTRLRHRSVAILVGLLVCCCRPASALDEADHCFRDKMRASRVGAAASFRCDARSHDDQRYLRCIDRISRRVSRLVSVADRRAALSGFLCPGDAETLAVARLSNWPLRIARTTFPQESRFCASLRSRAARRFASGYGLCIEAGVDSGFDVQDCAASARVGFDYEWASVSAMQGCASSAPASVRSAIELDIDESAARLEVRCGDAHVAGFEQCDDGATATGDGCSEDCHIETCTRAGAEVRCVACPPGAVPDQDAAGCVCPAGTEGEPGSCTDIDECASGGAACPKRRPCVNLQGGWACAIPCTAEALHEALASCGAPSGAIAFDCSDTTIAIPGGFDPAAREVSCNDLVVDGAGRNIAFELDPQCWRTTVAQTYCPGGLEDDGSCFCPDIDAGEQFLALRGDRNVVRDLTVRGFFDGIPVRGRDNLVENLRFERMCDDAFGSGDGGSGNRFRHIEVRSGCDKCSESAGLLEDTDPDARTAQHYNAIFSDIDFEGCRTPLRVASGGRFLLEDLRMRGADSTFPCDGPRFSAPAGLRSIIEIRRSSVEGCRRGIRFGNGSEAIVRDSRVASCSLRGVRLTGTAKVLIEGTTIEENGGGRSSESGFGGVAAAGGGELDLGGGLLEIDGQLRSSAGQNSLCNNAGPDKRARDLDAGPSGAVAAAGNWWCPYGAPDGRVRGTAATLPVLDRAPLRFRAGP